MFSYDHSKLILRIQIGVFRSKHETFSVRDGEFDATYSIRSHHQQAQPKKIVECFPLMQIEWFLCIPLLIP